VILLDTHIWAWWVANDPHLTAFQLQHIQSNQKAGLGVSVVACWEVAKLVEVGRLSLTIAVKDWIKQALAYPAEVHLSLTPEIAVESTQLPGRFHRDPADQILVATARLLNLPFLAADKRILQYPHVQTLT
jgi:PIN domain nuclease of toxin-antitoxin system